MKFWITIFSGVAMGLISAVNDYSPIAEMHHLFVNKRRLLWSGVFAAAGFFLVMSAIVTAGIESALQLEVQGFLLWSALFTAASSFAVLGIICAGIARLMLPKPPEPAFSWAALDKKFQLSELLEKWMQQATELAHDATPASEPVRREPPPKDYSKTAFQERDAATQFSH